MRIANRLNYLFSNMNTSLIQSSSKLFSPIALRPGKRFSHPTSFPATQLHLRLERGGIVAGFEKLANGEIFLPNVTTLVEVTLDSDCIPQLHRRLWDDVCGTPDGPHCTSSKTMKRKRIPAIKSCHLGRNFIIESKSVKAGAFPEVSFKYFTPISLREAISVGVRLTPVAEGML